MESKMYFALCTKREFLTVARAREGGGKGVYLFLWRFLRSKKRPEAEQARYGVKNSAAANAPVVERLAFTTGQAMAGRAFLPRRVAKRLLRGVFPVPLFSRTKSLALVRDFASLLCQPRPSVGWWVGVPRGARH